jgi:predicted nucleotidyltransferase
LQKTSEQKESAYNKKTFCTKKVQTTKLDAWLNRSDKNIKICFTK